METEKPVENVNVSSSPASAGGVAPYGLLNEDTVIEETPKWADLDEVFDDKSVKIEAVFGCVVARQVEQYGADLSYPCGEAQELISLWSMDLEENCLPMWQEAVERYNAANERPFAQDVATQEDEDDDDTNHCHLGAAGGNDQSAKGGDDASGDTKNQGLEGCDCTSGGTNDQSGIEQGDGLAAALILGDEPQMMNDAELLGEDHPDMQALLNKPAVFMTGDLYGQKDHRNTQDGDWNRVEMSWLEWLDGADKGKRTWGLTRHPVNKHKEGSSIVLADAIDGARKDGAIKTMYAIGLDINSGAKLKAVKAKLQELNLFAILYTSHSNGKDTLTLKHDDIMRKLKLDESPNRTQIQMYLREHHKDRFDDEFIQTIEIGELRKQTPDGLRTILKTEPLDKFRVILPLWEPVELADLGATVNAWKEAWADAVVGVGVNMLGVNIDATCSDVNRLFYTPRHKAGSDWYCAVIMGRPLRFGEIEPYSKARYVKERGLNDDPFAAVGGSTKAETYGDGSGEREIFETESGINLNDWHKKYKSRFLIADVIETFCPDKLRVAGGEKAGTCHLECPYEHEHSTEGGTATMAMNPDECESGYWTIFCRHDACQGRHKLEFLKAMLDEGWFPESVLTDDEWNIPLPDEDLPPESLSPEEAVAAIESAGIGKASNEEDIRGFMFGYLDADMTTQNNITEALGSSRGSDGATSLNPSQVKALWKALKVERSKAKVKADAERRAETKTPDYLPVEQATAKSVSKAASAAKWLPNGFTHCGGWFGTMENDKFKPVCREFEVVYCADGSKGQTRTNQLTIRYQHRSDQMGIVESTFRIGDTYKDSGTILGNLRNEGLDFQPNAKTEEILTLLRAVSSEREGVYRAKSGWTEDRDAYVHPTGKSVKRAGDTRLYVLDKAMRVSAETKGTIEQYADAMNTALRGKNAKLFLPGSLLGAVGMLADFLGTEHAVIVANEGKKNSGKTTSLKGGISFHAVASVQGLMFSANATETAFEAMAMKASGAAMAPDNSGASNRSADDEQRQIYQYANRMGRGRGTTTGGLQELNEWNGAMGISTERGLLARLQTEGADTKSGVQSRVFTVSYDGAETLNKTDDADLLAAYDVLAHGGVYGVAWEPFAVRLLELGVDAVRMRVSAYEKAWGAAVSGGERVVTTGALLAVASEICQEIGLYPANDFEATWDESGALVAPDRDADKLNVQMLLKGALDDTLAQRAGVLDTDRQATDNLRLEIIRAVGRKQIIAHGDTDSAWGDILGRWTTKDEESTFKEPDRSLRTYILPVDRLHALGVKTDVSALVEQLRGDGALVLPKPSTKFYKKGLWQTTPGEGNVKSLRLSGVWVHGEGGSD